MKGDKTDSKEDIREGTQNPCAPVSVLREGAGAELFGVAGNGYKLLQGFISDRTKRDFVLPKATNQISPFILKFAAGYCTFFFALLR